MTSIKDSTEHHDTYSDPNIDIQTEFDEEDFGVQIDYYAQSKKWNFAVVALSVVALLTEVTILTYCIYRLATANRPNTPDFVWPTSWSVFASTLFALLVPLFGFLSCISTLHRKTYMAFCYTHLVLLGFVTIVQIACSAVPFFVFQRNMYGGAAIVFVLLIFGLNAMVAIGRIVVASKEDHNVKGMETAFISSSL